MNSMKASEYCVIVQLVSFPDKYNLYTFDKIEDLKTFKLCNPKTHICRYNENNGEISDIAFETIDKIKHYHFHNYLYSYF